MRWRVALFVLTLVSMPAAALAPTEDCPNERDPSQLVAAEDGLAALRAAGFGVKVTPLAEVLRPSDVPGLLQGGADTHACGGKIRPGAQLIIQSSFLCTTNFLYEDDQFNLYIGTAGHCIRDLAWTSLVIPGVGDIGDPVFSICCEPPNNGVGRDFALIKIDPALYGKVEPTMCHWGGPVKLGERSDGGTAAGNRLLVHYGWGFGYGQSAATRPRMAFARSADWTPTGTLNFDGLVAGGDSGSGIQTNYGAAAGVITHTVQPLAGQGVPLGVALSVGTVVSHGLDLAKASTGRSYTLYASERNVDLTGLTIGD